ncbi:MAG: restriction endonuclease subunit S [Nodularia sp. (in: Bacteria)]|nr:MAG: restriction endonuclease subunit S [Nodularia sp. (in: cyanobacteria)]
MCDLVVENEEFQDSPLGKIPKDWEVSPIEDKLQRIIDYRGKTPEKTTSGVPLVTAKNVRDGYLDTEPQEYINEKDYDLWMRRGLPNPGDVLFTTEAPLGNVARVPSYKIALAQRLLTLCPNPNELDAGYLFWLLNWLDSRQKFEQKSTGSTVLGIKQSVFRKILFRFPPLPEQQRIAEILDKVDNAIAHTASLISKLKQIKAGLLHDLLTRGLDENGQLRNPQAHPEQFQDSPLGMIPKDWNIVDLLSLCDKITDGSHQSVKTSDSGVPFLYVSCVRDGQILWEQAAKISEKIYIEISKGREPLQGLILYTAVGSYGHAALVKNNRKFSFQRHIAYVLPNIEIIIPEYLVTFLNSSHCRKYADKVALGNAQKTVTLNALSSFPIVLPEWEEQQRITEIINKHDTRICKEEAYLNKLKLQKQGLIHDLLTGKVRVKN